MIQICSRRRYQVREASTGSDSRSFRRTGKRSGYCIQTSNTRDGRCSRRRLAGTFQIRCLSARFRHRSAQVHRSTRPPGSESRFTPALMTNTQFGTSRTLQSPFTWLQPAPATGQDLALSNRPYPEDPLGVWSVSVPDVSQKQRPITSDDSIQSHVDGRLQWLPMSDSLRLPQGQHR